ncbi:hypothetical protein HU200_046060 [Digitaria exilis]|uniref:Uncharacterized protein n=1 Tax=Digitaria exilis TaxID=1010633 RepID=A0A835EE86_9POAL|nr:hypothetical protein HU200_046060 [Digitaria exilis]
MCVFRRFLNLILPGSTPGVKLLRRINLARQQLFYPDTPRRSESAWVKEDLPLNMEMIRLSGRSFSFRASDSDLKNERKMDCFPLGDCKVICADNSGGFIFDLSTRRVGTIPPICKPSIMPISVFVPKADVDDDIYHEGNGSSLFLMERFLQLEEAGIQESNQFVGVINRMPATFRSNKSWHCHILAPPPFLREPCYWDNNRPEITAYGVVGGGSQVCISVKGVGTYCLDTASHTWSEVGKWMLPFGGKVEYVPELKLWFGLSAGAQQLAAADLSNMDCEPQLVGPWKELEVELEHGRLRLGADDRENQPPRHPEPAGAAADGALEDLVAKEAVRSTACSRRGSVNTSVGVRKVRAGKEAMVPPDLVGRRVRTSSTMATSPNVELAPSGEGPENCSCTYTRMRKRCSLPEARTTTGEMRNSSRAATSTSSEGERRSSWGSVRPFCFSCGAAPYAYAYRIVGVAMKGTTGQDMEDRRRAKMLAGLRIRCLFTRLVSPAAAAMAC